MDGQLTEQAVHLMTCLQANMLRACLRDVPEQETDPLQCAKATLAKLF